MVKYRRPPCFHQDVMEMEEDKNTEAELQVSGVS